MKRRRIDEQIREYYRSRNLSDESRARLKAMLSGALANRRWRWGWMQSAIAAAFLIVVGFGILWLGVFQDASESSQQLAVALARQAALGHNAKQELEFRVRECAELRERMKSLDFTPVEPAMMQHMNMRLVGARYTTIEGAIAVQIAFVDERGVPCTLYQVRAVEKLAGVRIVRHHVDGLQVDVWQEKGLLMVLARPLG